MIYSRYSTSTRKIENFRFCVYGKNTKFPYCIVYLTSNPSSLKQALCASINFKQSSCSSPFSSISSPISGLLTAEFRYPKLRDCIFLNLFQSGSVSEGNFRICVSLPDICFRLVRLEWASHVSFFEQA